MRAARHLRLALALMLGLASASKRPRGSDANDSGRKKSCKARASTAQSLSTTSTGADTVIESSILYLLTRTIQIAGCLFNDAVACSGGFEDPVGYAAILLEKIFVKRYPKYETTKSPSSGPSPVEQLRSELVEELRLRHMSADKVLDVGVDELLIIAVKQLMLSVSWVSDERNLSKSAFGTVSSWDSQRYSCGDMLSGLKEVFMAAEKTTARSDRSVFVWPSGQSSSSDLYPEERLYAAAVVIMCRQLGVEPVSVYLVACEFESSLPLPHPNWRNPTLQVIAMAAGVTVYGLDLADSCKSLVGKLGISEELVFIPKLKQHRNKPPYKNTSKFNIHKMSVLDEPAPLVVPLPTKLRGSFAEADRLLLIRSLQVAYLVLGQTAVDHRGFGNLFFQASIVVSHLLKYSARSVSPELTEHKPRQDFTPLDLLRVIAEADPDHRPELSAVSTAGDVMTAAAQVIFRYLYLTLPTTVLAKVEKFNNVGSPDLHFAGMSRLKNVLLQHDAPYVLGSSSTLTQLYEATDVILWAVFRVSSKRYGNSSEAFVLCTREMYEKIPVACQYTCYFLPAIVQILGSATESVEAAVLDLISQVAPAPESLGDLQTPRAMPQEPVATPQAAGPSDQAVTAASQVAHGHSEVIADHILFKATVLMGTLFQEFSLPIRSLRDIQSMVLTAVPNDLEKAGELTSVNRLAATSQLHTLDVKLKRGKIPFSETDHVTVLLDALVALHFLRNGAATQLAGIPRTRMSDIGAEDKGNLTLFLGIALLKATSMQPTEGSMSAAFSDLTNLLAEAVKATATG